MINRMLLALGLAVAIAGCSSVPLEEAPVVDKAPVVVSAGGAGTGGVGQSSVRPVQADEVGPNRGGPVNVSRLVYFDYDSYSIKPEFQNLISAHANFMKQNPGRRMNIEGHTDERGGREYNLALGQRRSEAVRRALGLLGVPDAQLEAVSFGKEKPAVPGSDESAYSQNRRAEIVYR
ncbi:peptidoglycan-associated lipoprotein Pal [Caenimonas sp. SL110]|uniref:peptidoglycan-associated lipoprotein Pal n=1 Tax=Caenimonas sp. SL110 TaxID=1450524 RepID=UPI0006535C4C|nr:peptidoglycan-associated lipoprotein Pal [Caenimonas sp. SL110]